MENIDMNFDLILKPSDTLLSDTSVVVSVSQQLDILYFILNKRVNMF